MDPDLLRLLLAILGVLLVLGIYLWDRYKRSAPKPRVARRPPENLSIDTEVVDAAETERLVDAFEAVA